jgi:hypothetical protein
MEGAKWMLYVRCAQHYKERVFDPFSATEILSNPSINLKDCDRLYDPQAGLLFLPRRWSFNLRSSCLEPVSFL